MSKCTNPCVIVIASEARQSSAGRRNSGLPRHFVPRNNGAGEVIGATPPTGSPPVPRSMQNPLHCVLPQGFGAQALALQFGYRADWSRRFSVPAKRRTHGRIPRRSSAHALGYLLQASLAKPPIAVVLRPLLDVQCLGGFQRSLLPITTVAPGALEANRSHADCSVSLTSRSKHSYQQVSPEINLTQFFGRTRRDFEIQSLAKPDQFIDPIGRAWAGNSGRDRGLSCIKMAEFVTHIAYSIMKGQFMKFGVQHQLPQMFLHRAPMRGRDLTKTQFGGVRNVSNGQTCQDIVPSMMSMQSMYAMRAH
jgi:hypothetical protein